MIVTSMKWGTPDWLIQEVVRFFGEIDLDPCSGPDRRVPAKVHYTEVENGLWHVWEGRVYCNPPYGRSQIAEWTEKALRDPVEELILLLPVRTGSRWFQALLKAECSFVFLGQRVKYVCAEPGKTVNNGADPPNFDSVLVYRGPNHWHFRNHFAAYGAAMIPLALVQTALASSRKEMSE